MKRRLRFLTVERVVAMHDVLLERFGGIEGGGPRGESYEGADAAVQAVKNSYMMIDLQTRSESGESASRLILDIAASLTSPRRRK